jgi:hypothetical protein
LFLPFLLRNLSSAFGLTASKSWYPHYFKKMENLNYVRQIPDRLYYGEKEMSVGERVEFLAWYEEQKSEVSDNRRVLESYCQDDITVLRQACRVLRGEFMLVGNIDEFKESVTIASSCNEVSRKLFLKHDTIVLIPMGGYKGNVNYSNKTMMCLVYREQTDGCHIPHGRNGREYWIPEQPNLSVDGFCAETRLCMNFMVAIGTDICASHSVTSLLWQATGYLSAMKKPWLDWPRSRRQGTKSKFSGNVTLTRRF